MPSTTTRVVDDSSPSLIVLYIPPCCCISIIDTNSAMSSSAATTTTTRSDDDDPSSDISRMGIMMMSPSSSSLSISSPTEGSASNIHHGGDHHAPHHHQQQQQQHRHPPEASSAAAAAASALGSSSSSSSSSINNNNNHDMVHMMMMIDPASSPTAPAPQPHHDHQPQPHHQPPQIATSTAAATKTTAPTTANSSRTRRSTCSSTNHSNNNSSSNKNNTTTDEEHAESDAYIANALKNMSLQERDILYHELHGVADVIEETPELIEESFRALKEELQVQTSKTFVGSLNCRPFQLAQEKDYPYVHSEFLYKAFLRAERFDVQASAHRMIRFYEYKLKSFGEEALCQDITQKLLSDKDLKIYRNGYNQILPCRDVMGRAIFVLFPRLTFVHPIGTPDRLGRILMYENWSAIQDEETQRKGATCVVVVSPGATKKEEEGGGGGGGQNGGTTTTTKPPPPPPQQEQQQHATGSASTSTSTADASSSSSTAHSMMDFEMIPTLSAALMSLPLRFAVVHNCFADSQWKHVMKLGMQLISRDLRARNKIHFGASIMQCAYELVGYGIPPDCLPVNMHGEVKTKQHVDFIKMRKKQEEMVEQGKLITLSARKTKTTTTRQGGIRKPQEDQAEDNPSNADNHRGTSSSSYQEQQQQQQQQQQREEGQEHQDDDQEEEEEEDHYESKRVIVVPAQADILLGRGKPIHSHAGNVRLHQLVDDAIPRYEASRKLDKTGLTFELVNIIKNEYGGRFLKQDSSGVWLVTDDEASRNKVSHLFRARRGAVLAEIARRRKQQQQQQQGDGSTTSEAQADVLPSADLPPPPAGKRTKL